MKPCLDCLGEGRIIIGEHYVSREMAIGVAIPELEGSFYEFEYAICVACEGIGLLTEDGNKINHVSAGKESK